MTHSGNLFAYFNDNYFADNVGTFTITINSFVVNIDSASNYWTLIGLFSPGSYPYTITGSATISVPGWSSYDANGVGYTPPVSPGVAPSGFVAPGLISYSIVGKIICT